MLEIVNTVLLAFVLAIQLLFLVPAQDFKYLAVLLAPIAGVGGVAIAHQFYPQHFEAALWAFGFLVLFCGCAWAWIETRKEKRLMRQILANEKKAKAENQR
jgi:hypothetical protein